MRKEPFVGFSWRVPVEGFSGVGEGVGRSGIVGGFSGVGDTGLGTMGFVGFSGGTAGGRSGTGLRKEPGGAFSIGFSTGLFSVIGAGGGLAGGGLDVTSGGLDATSGGLPINDLGGTGLGRSGFGRGGPSILLRNRLNKKNYLLERCCEDLVRLF